ATNRLVEAVLLAQTYKPSRAAELAVRWKQSLEKAGKAKTARTIGVPPGVEGADEDLFPEWDEFLKLEKDGGTTNDLIDVVAMPEESLPAEEKAAPAAEAEAESEGKEEETEAAEPEEAKEETSSPAEKAEEQAKDE
ncbi:hypothetical protein KEM55_006353, partial [Ascosphaera atra]